jgi:hypothetical protein
MLKHLEKRFPQWQKQIEQLFKDDPDFRASCGEYEETAKTLAFWIWLSRLPARQINRQKHEHKELLQELETEILMTLRKQYPAVEKRNS